MERNASSQGDIENGLLKSNGQHTIRERGSSKSLDDTFFAKVLGNLLPFDGSNSCDKKSTKPNQEEEKVPLLKTQSSNADRENQKIGINVEKYENNYEKRKKNGSGKASKPPRHPSFDAAAADKKLVREIAELARRERARIERLKLAKKNKTPKASSCTSSSSVLLFAMFVSLLLFVIVIFQAYVHNGRNFIVGLSTRSMASFNVEGSGEHYKGSFGFGYHLIN